MKLMKSFGIIFVLYFSQMAYAAISKNIKCPSTAVVAASGMDKAYKWPFGEDEWIVVKNEAKFDTNQLWYFSVMQVKAPNAEVALVNAPRYIAALSLDGEPEVDENDSIVCHYAGRYERQSVTALAIHTTAPFKR